MIGLEGIAKETIVPDDEASGPGIYELRRYKVALGYDKLMDFMDHMERGMHAKLEASDPGSKLCSVLNSDIGDISEVCLVLFAAADDDDDPAYYSQASCSFLRERKRLFDQGVRCMVLRRSRVC